jgi:hypothetical protein
LWDLELKMSRQFIDKLFLFAAGLELWKIDIITLNPYDCG